MIWRSSYILNNIWPAIAKNDNYYDDDINKPTDNTNRQPLWKSTHLASAIHYYNTSINIVNITKPHMLLHCLYKLNVCQSNEYLPNNVLAYLWMQLWIVTMHLLNFIQFCKMQVLFCEGA